MGKKIDLTGQKFGRLLVIKKSNEIRDHHILWECKCSCGNENIVLVKSFSLQKGNTQSCGCLKKERDSAMGKANRNPDRNKVINKSLHTNFRGHATRTRMEFTLTIEELCTLIYSKCYYILRELEYMEVIKIKKSGRNNVIYVNPFFLRAGEKINKSTCEMFRDTICYLASLK